MKRQWPRGSRSAGPLLIALAIVLAACGSTEERTPTSVPSTAPVTTTPPVVSPSASPAGSAAGGTPVTVTGMPAASTVGELADRIAAAWTGVTSYRVNEVTFPSESATPAPLLAASPAASPVAGPTSPSTFLIDGVVLPDTKRRQIFVGQEVVSEIIAAGGQVYARGAIVQQYVDPALSPEIWVTLTAADLAAGTPLSQVLQGFLSPVAAPLSALPAEQRALPVTFVRQTAIENRACDLYHIVQTTLTGERFDVEIAIDASGLPCLIQTSGGGQTTVATYVTFNEPLTIEAPTVAITLPAASPTPPPSPAAG